MSRRSRGEGWAIRKRTDGRGFQTGFTDHAGKRHSIHGKTALEARTKRDIAIRDSEAGVIAPLLRQTVGSFVTAWYADVQVHRLAPRSAERYHGIITRYIVPRLGKMPLARLQSQHVARLYSDLSKELQPASIRYVHAVLRQAMQQAVAWRLLAVNPCNGVKAPRKPRVEVKPLGAVQAKALLEAAKGDPLEALYVMALHTGMRLGELLALDWACVDWSRGTVDVRGTLHRVGKGNYDVQQPKTERSRRTITLNPSVLEALRQHRVREAARMLELGRGMDDSALIFTDRWGEPIYWGRVTERHLEPLCRAAGLPRITFHSLRHTAASMMLSSGVPVHIVSQILGHSSPNVTLGTYAHLMPGDQETAMRTLEKALVG